MNNLDKLHPGYVLKKEFLEPMNISHEYFSEETGIPPNDLLEILNCRKEIVLPVAEQLSRFFGIPEIYWLDLQNQYDEVSRIKIKN